MINLIAFFLELFSLVLTAFYADNQLHGSETPFTNAKDYFSGYYEVPDVVTSGKPIMFYVGWHSNRYPDEEPI